MDRIREKIDTSSTMKDSFLQLTTRDMIDRVGLKGLENYTFVFPMQRAGLFVRQYLADYLRENELSQPLVLPHYHYRPVGRQPVQVA